MLNGRKILKIASKQIKVYLVEDNPDLRENLVEALKELSSARVISYADNETDAINWLAVYSDTVDVVVLDIHLPSGSGYGILRQMREAGLLHPIVVFTNNASPEVRQKCLAAGATVFFDKTSEQSLFFDYVRKQ
jgi:DNA-binding NarL/FixJ family response regulator